MLIARNTKGNTKTYYKSASSWNSGNTSALRQEIESAKNNWDKASKALNSAGAKTLWNLLAGSRRASYLVDLGQINNIHAKL